MEDGIEDSRNTISLEVHCLDQVGSSLDLRRGRQNMVLMEARKMKPLLLSEGMTRSMAGIMWAFCLKDYGRMGVKKDVDTMH